MATNEITLSDEAREILGILVTGYQLIAFPTAKFYITSRTGDRIFSWEAVQECQKEGLIDGLEITLKGRRWLLYTHLQAYLAACTSAGEVRSLDVVLKSEIAQYWKDNRVKMQQRI